MAPNLNKTMSLLEGRFLERFAGDTPEAAALIKKEVAKFVQAKSKKICSTDLQNLERKIERDVNKLKKTLSAKAKGEDVVSDIVLPNERTKKTVEPNEKIPFNYLVFSEAIEYEHKREQQRLLRERRTKQLQVKRELDDQVAARAGRGGEEKEENEKYASYVKKKHQEWQEEEREKRRVVFRKNMETKYQRDIQLEENKRRKQKIEKARKDIEAALIQKAIDETKQEEERTQQKIREQRAYMSKVQRENVLQKAHKEREAIRLQDEDKRLQREYAARLDEQERIRTETFEKMKEKSANNQQMYLKATEERTRQERLDEEKALRLQQEKIAENARKLKEQERKRQQDKRDMDRALSEQVRNQRNREEVLAKENEIFAKAYKEDAIQAIENERQAELKRRRAALQHKRDLQAQIEQRKQRPQDTDSSVMTEHEMKINMPKLLEFSKDDGMVDAIACRMKRSLAAKEAKLSRRMGKDREDEDIDFVF